MKKVYVLTHGQSSDGYNPCMTPEGVTQIVEIGLYSISKISKPSLILVGVGVRFFQTMEVIEGSGIMIDVPIKHSPFLGTADGFGKNKDVALQFGNITSDEYMGLVNTPGFCAWSFVNNLPDKTLLLTGRELLIALELEHLHDDGVLLDIDLETKTGRRLS